MKDLEKRNGYYYHPTSEISNRAVIGEGTYVWHFSHIREDSSIGENCVIGKNVYIDKGVQIGNNVKIQNGVSIYYGVKIEDDIFIGPNATFTNDFAPRAFIEDYEMVKTLFRKGCSIGANATIVCGNVIGAYSMVAAGSVVTYDVPPFTLVMGNPARIVGVVCKNGHKMKQINKFKEKVRLLCSICDEEISFDLKVMSNLDSI